MNFWISKIKFHHHSAPPPQISSPGTSPCNDDRISFSISSSAAVHLGEIPGARWVCVCPETSAECGATGCRVTVSSKDLQGEWRNSARFSYLPDSTVLVLPCLSAPTGSPWQHATTFKIWSLKLCWTKSKISPTEREKKKYQVYQLHLHGSKELLYIILLFSLQQSCKVGRSSLWFPYCRWRKGVGCWGWERVTCLRPLSKFMAEWDLKWGLSSFWFAT